MKNCIVALLLLISFGITNVYSQYLSFNEIIDLECVGVSNYTTYDTTEMNANEIHAIINEKGRLALELRVPPQHIFNKWFNKKAVYEAALEKRERLLGIMC